MIDQKFHTPRVGIGVMIFKDKKVLLGKRRGSHGAGEYAFPGGHLDPGESFAACAVRETNEECGIAITNIDFQLLANVLEYLPKHYVHIGLTADWESGQPRTLEPEKCDGWDWYALDDLPQPLFAPAERMIECYRSGVRYLDSGTNP